MMILKAIEKVLKRAGTPLRTSEIARLVKEAHPELLNGKTSLKTVELQLNEHIKKNKGFSFFTTDGSGIYGLRKYDLSFTIENLGAIEEGKFTQKPLTLFCGHNNTGKTWVMYSLYRFYSMVKEFNEMFGDDLFKVPIKELNNFVSERLPEGLHADDINMISARYELNMPPKYWKGWKEKDVEDVFLIPSERNGLHLFFQELRSKRTALLHQASKKDINLHDLLRDVMGSKYASPIADYIDWLNNLTELSKNDDKEFRDFGAGLEKNLAEGKYKVDRRTGGITFQPRKERGRARPERLGLHLTSSAVKSFFGLWFYLEHQAKKGDILMIDEPELNLHPEKQIEMARLIVRMVNAGLKVVVSTHSDYIVREINSLIMLNKDKSLAKKYGYQENETLNHENVGAYLFDGHTIEEFKITPDDGIFATTFDETITKQNNTNNGIYYALQEKNG